MKDAKLIVAVGLCLMISPLSCSREWSDDRVAETYKRAAAIIEAAEAYKASEGVFPGSLDDLVPRYIKQILPPTAGSKKVWHYQACEGGSSFNLWFGDATDYEQVHIYDSSDQHWTVDTK